MNISPSAEPCFHPDEGLGQKPNRRRAVGAAGGWAPGLAGVPEGGTGQRRAQGAGCGGGRRTSPG